MFHVYFVVCFAVHFSMLRTTLPQIYAAQLVHKRPVVCAHACPGVRAVFPDARTDFSFSPITFPHLPSTSFHLQVLLVVACHIRALLLETSKMTLQLRNKKGELNDLAFSIGCTERKKGAILFASNGRYIVRYGQKCTEIAFIYVEVSTVQRYQSWQ
jgi:hypothetical protein